MTVKKEISLFLALLMLLLSACNGQPANPNSEREGKQDSDTYQSHSGTDEAGHVSVQVPTEAEIQSVLENDEVKVIWAVEENTFSLPDIIYAYEAEEVDGDTVWNALFSQNDLVSRQQFGEYSEMLITLDGTEYAGRLYNSGLIEFGSLPELPTVFSSENLMQTLSGVTDMDCILGEPDDALDTSIYYQFSVDGITVDRKGYSVGATVYSGPFASIGSSYVAIYTPVRLGSKDTLAVSDFISYEQAKTLCTVDLMAGTDYPTVVVFDHSELVYYYQAQQQMILPAWRITGTWYSLSDDGTLSSSTTVRLIDAQTGELHW